MTTIQTQIQTKIQSFAQELEQLVRQAAMVAVGEALGTGTPKDAKAAVRRKGAKKATIAKAPAKKTTKKKAMPKPAKKAATKKPAKTGGKRKGRSPLPIGPATEKILGHIKAHPGQRSEDVRKAVGTPKNVWTLAIAKLVDEKKITKKGEKRATTFTAK